MDLEISIGKKRKKLTDADAAAFPNKNGLSEEEKLKSRSNVGTHRTADW